MTAEEILLIDGAQTSVGSFGACFPMFPPMSSERQRLERLWSAAESMAPIGKVIMECVGQVGSDADNARCVALPPAWPKARPRTP